jgi:hypothetical protein
VAGTYVAIRFTVEKKCYFRTVRIWAVRAV